MRQDDISLAVISIIVPIFNEETLIPELYRRLATALELYPADYDYEVIFVNDGSKDQSKQQLLEIQSKDPRFKVIDLARNFGHQKAITAGIDLSSGDAVIVMDGDLQDPPEVICDFIKKWEEGFHVVYGVRRKREGETHFKLFTAKIFYRFISSLSEVDIPLDAGDFRLIDRKVANALMQVREEHRYIRGIISWLGFKQIGVEYERDRRYAGVTKYTLRKMIRFALDGVTSFSEKPLYLSSYLGLGVASLAMIWGAWIIAQRLLGFSHTIIGWSSTVAAIAFLGGIQLCCIGILGQYLGRIHSQVKQRPLYVIGELHGFSGEQKAQSDHSHPLTQQGGLYRANHSITARPDLS